MVFKKGNMIYYFINNEYCYSTEMETNVSGFHFGFLVPPQGTVLVDNLNIAKKRNTNPTVNAKQNQSVEFEIVRVKSLKQAEIRNK